MKTVLTLLTALYAWPGLAAVTVPLTVQEALYQGGSTGVNRTNEPFCMGVPLADSAGISSTGALGLAGATAGQFRVLGTWPDGKYKWVKVCGVVPNLTAGGTATVTLSDSGSGNFGGPNLATDNGATITVTTGAATFTIKKANFNILDQVVVGSTQLMASSSSPSRGVILTGPDPAATYPANVTCGSGTGQSACTTVYSSANDSSSTCVIEENGPVLAVVKCQGNHVDSAGHPYMHYTLRESFYKGKPGIKITTILRNADYDTSTVPSPDFKTAGTFNASDKQFQSYELRLAAGITGTLNYTIATEASPKTGTLNQAGGTDSAYIYQGQSDWMTPQMSNPVCAVGGTCYNGLTTDVGYTLAKNGATLASGTSSVYPAGYADISDASGNGIEIGMYQFAAQGPASLEFNGGGADVRIGLKSAKNSIPSTQGWTSWKIFDSFVEFHAGAPASLANEFLKYQHYLVARPSAVSYINGTSVFPWRIVDPAVEDNYYINVANTSDPPVAVNRLCWNGAPPCSPDRQVGGNAAGNAMAVGIVRGEWPWPEGGPLNQEEFRWSDLQKFYQRGMTGRFLNSAHWYEWLAGAGWPHSDGIGSSDSTVNGFTWRSRPHWGTANAELDGGGRPVRACGGNCWPDGLHFHWYGYPDFYMMTGDETLHEALMPLKDYYLNSETYQGGFNIVANGGVTARGIGIELMGASRMADFLGSVGDPDRDNVLAQGLNMYQVAVKPDPCVNGYPAGCTVPALTGIGGGDPIGVSRVRGVHLGSRSAGFCPGGVGANYYRSQEPFQTSILMEGILFLRNSAGAAWPENATALDLAYGLSQWGLTEGYNDDGNTKWQSSNPFNNGFRYLIWTDFPNTCPNGTPVVSGQTFQVGTKVYDAYSAALPEQGMWFNFYLQYLTKGTVDWERQFKAALLQVAYHQSNFPADFGSYQIGILIDAINSAATPVLQDVPFTAKDNGGGSYTLTWTVPSGAQRYRIKWSSKTIAPSNGLLNFDNLTTNTFGLSPDQYSTWFGANNVNEPAPGAAGQSQTFTISAGASGLTAPNFSVKAYVSGGVGGGTGPASSLSLISGNGQTGTVGQALATPLTVKAADANGNGVSGVTVTFAVVTGGGSLTATSVVTNSLGLASSTLTLGAAAGTNTVTASSGTLVGSPITVTATGAASAPSPTTLSMVSGNSQTGVAGQQLGSPFVVKVTDAGGNAVPNIAVTFSVSQGGGVLSAAQTTTNSQGLALTILTLGPAAGINTVVATSGTLAGSPISFTATATVATSGPGDVTWLHQTPTTGWPGGAGYLTLQYDPASQQTILYGVRSGSVSIYSTDIFFYNSGTNSFTHLGGTGSVGDTCVPDTPTWPGDRHPLAQMAIDTKRNVLWMYGGLNMMCGGAPLQDMYYLTLNADPTTDTWHRVIPAHLPAQAGMSSMAYDPDDDVLISFGYDGGPNTHDTWLYCRTAENPTPGVLTAKQSAAGCSGPDDWYEVSVTGGVTPPGAGLAGLVYDTATKQIIQFGAYDKAGVRTMETYSYNVPLRTWTPKGLSTAVPPASTTSDFSQPAMAYSTATHKIYYHQNTTTTARDWVYDPAADTWTPLTSTGVGATTWQALAYDSSRNVLVGWNQSWVTDLWQGSLGSSVISSNPCDLNKDGIVNSLDVQVAIAQTIGNTACTNADLLGNGSCSVVDVQRVINASQGGVCRVGP